MSYTEVFEDIVSIISVLQSDNIFYTPNSKKEIIEKLREKFIDPNSDHLTLRNIFKEYKNNKNKEEFCKENYLNDKALQKSMEIYQQIIGYLKRIKINEYKKDEVFEDKNESTESEAERLRKTGTIQSHIYAGDQYKNIDYIKNAINNTNIEDINSDNENFDEEVPSEIISKLEEIASKAPKLVLTIKDSLFLKVGLRIKINALGLEGNSLRNKKDGFTYFGLMAPNERESDINIDFSTSDITNNINNYKDEPIQYGRQFGIRFDINKSCYYIKDCSNGSGYGSFMKIINQIKIKDKTLINIGGNYLAFSFGTNDYEQLDDEANEKENENESILTIIVFSGESNNISYVFNQNQTNKIYIGKKKLG